MSQRAGWTKRKARSMPAHAHDARGKIAKAQEKEEARELVRSRR